MFSKYKPRESEAGLRPAQAGEAREGQDFAAVSETPARTQKAKPPPSVLAPDLKIVGNISTTGDLNVEGKVEGDIHAHLLTVGESAVIKGECSADDVVVHGRVMGRVRGLKVRLTSKARVEGDIFHKTIAIESGAQFDGSVQRLKDPTGERPAAPPPKASGSHAAEAGAQATPAKA